MVLSFTPCVFTGFFRVNTYFVYVIWNANHQRYYIGQTENVGERVRQHNDPQNTFSRYTKRFSGSWELIHKEGFETRRDALAREKALKSGQGRQWLKDSVLSR